MDDGPQFLRILVVGGHDGRHPAGRDWMVIESAAYQESEHAEQQGGVRQQPVAEHDGAARETVPAKQCGNGERGNYHQDDQ